MKLPSTDICKILEACKGLELKSLKYGELSIEFAGNNLTEMHVVAQDSTSLVPFASEQIEDIQDDITSKLLMDPLLYEEMVNEE